MAILFQLIKRYTKIVLSGYVKGTLFVNKRYL